jgi:hypothetical protein
MKPFTALSSTGQLGDTPFEEVSFFKGLRENPDFMGADAGSCDIGPTYLGGDIGHNPAEWEMHDIELLLTASRERRIPLVIASCGGAGTNRAVDSYVEMVSEVTRKKGIQRFRLAKIYSEVTPQYLSERIDRGERIRSLGHLADLDKKTLEETSHIVGMMGVEPMIEAFKMSAEVIIAGRACDDAIFAALPVHLGYPKGLSYHMGKLIECASLVGTPTMVKESVLATLSDEDLILEPMHPDQRCTPTSVAGHSLYERSDPYRQLFPGGMLDTSQSVFEAIDPRRTRITRSAFVPDPVYKVKLEGAGPLGYRAYTIVGIRDKVALNNLDSIFSDARLKVEALSGFREGRDYQLLFHVYGRNGVMGPLEPIKEFKSHEVGIVCEAISRDEHRAKLIAKLAKFRIFYAKYPAQKNSSGGGGGVITDEVLTTGRMSYRWTVDHLMELKNPCEIFPIILMEIGK